MDFSLSDFFGIDNDLDLIKKYGSRAKDALILREFGNKLIEIIGGRSIHPLTPTIGGFLKLPEKAKLTKLFYQSEEALIAAKNLAKLFSGLKYPEFIRSAPYASMQHLNEYAFYDGLIKTPTKEKIVPSEFMATVKEYQLRNSANKGAFYHGKPYMVGALSRINNNHNQLNSKAKKALKRANIHIPTFNPFHNILAQAVEIVHCAQEAQKLLGVILQKELKKEIGAERDELVKTKLKAIKSSAKGIEIIEAPRGTLYYFYEIDGAGKVINCNIITPTSQNLARLEKDLEEYLPKLIAQKTHKKEIEEKIKMLVRAYDPCLTCATH